MTRVKICGITNAEDAIHASNCGADELGFNFYAGSKRYVKPDSAREIIGRLTVPCAKVGVFVNESMEKILAISDAVGLDVIQLHGDEDAKFTADLGKRTERMIIKAFRIAPGFDIEIASEWPCDFPLFDSHSPNEYGGTGVPFDLEEFGFQIYFTLPGSAYIAGGLNPDNVAEAIQMTFPYAVDVASGVESAPGKKDTKKVEAFINNAKNA